MQNTTQYAGNNILWWKNSERGYTTNIDDAKIFTKKEALAQHQDRSTDKPWPVDYVRKHTSHTVDHQDLDLKEDLISGTLYEAWEKSQ